MIAPTQLWIGYSLLASAGALFLWGVEINGLHFWHFFRSRGRTWHDGRTRLTVREAASLAAGVVPRNFDQSDEAQSIASQLRYQLIRGRLPIEGAPAHDQSARRVARSIGGIQLDEVTLDSTFIVRSVLDAWIVGRTPRP